MRRTLKQSMRVEPMNSILIAAIASIAAVSSVWASNVSKVRVGALPPGMCVTATDTVVPCASLLPGPDSTSANSTCATPDGQRIGCTPQGTTNPLPDMVPGFQPSPEGAGARWRILKINGEPAVEGFGAPSITIHASAIHVATGCRGFSARILGDSSPSLFEIERAPVIAIACADELEAQELALAAIIGAASQRFIDDTAHLTISTPEGGALVAVPWREQRAQTPALATPRPPELAPLPPDTPRQ